MCLKNALHLLPSHQKIFSKQSNASVKVKSKYGNSNNNNSSESLELDETGGSLDESGEEEKFPMENSQQQHIEKKLFNCVWPSKPINIIELQSLRSSILTAIAFVALTLKDFISSVKYCNMLLDKEDSINMRYPISKGHRYFLMNQKLKTGFNFITVKNENIMPHLFFKRYLAHMYLAEALLFSDKIHESIENLNMNSKIEAESDISFVASSILLANNQSALQSEHAKRKKRVFFLFSKCTYNELSFLCSKKISEIDA